MELLYLASRYLERADSEKRATRTPGTLAPQTSPYKRYGTGSSYPRETKPDPSKPEELLAYVLESAPEGSLENLSNIVSVPRNKTDKLSEGGFSEVYRPKDKIPIRGKWVNVVIKSLTLPEKTDLEFVTRVSIFLLEIHKNKIVRND